MDDLVEQLRHGLRNVRDTSGMNQADRLMKQAADRIDILERTLDMAMCYMTILASSDNVEAKKIVMACQDALKGRKRELDRLGRLVDWYQKEFVELMPRDQEQQHPERGPPTDGGQQQNDGIKGK